MHRIEQVVTLWKLYRCFGARWLLFRLGYVVRARVGALRRAMPCYGWADRPLSTWLDPDVPSDPERYVTWRRQHGGRFVFDALPPPERLASVTDADVLVAEADAHLAGRWQYFGHEWHDSGFPPDWHGNPVTGRRMPDARHWSEIDDFAYGDIKYVWEPNRFAVVYRLVRAYAMTGSGRYAEAFWMLIEDWARANAPQRGVNWKCGQETSLRIMAWCFGLYGFVDCPSSTPERVARLVAMIACQAQRVEGNIDYARWQKNNHAISEAVGLWTVGILFPELRDAARWRETGRRILEEESGRQIHADGSYVQHSTNYHRVMLDDLAWALRIGELNARPLPRSVYDRVDAAVEFLYQLLEITSGEAPQVGSNDGALVLPLSTCAITDHRPSLQGASVIVRGTRLFGVGPWDEQAAWLCGTEALDASIAATSQTGLAASDGGYYTIRGKESWAFIRCASYRDRPGHMDQLHVDLWCRGVNIAIDPGTYRYNADSPWNNALVRTGVHNTVVVDGGDQMTAVSRFLAVDWAQGTVSASGSVDGFTYWQGHHDGYRRQGILHRRTVVHDGVSSWWIWDDVQGGETHACRLHWLLVDRPHRWAVAEHQASLDLQVGEEWHRIHVRCDRPAQFDLLRAGTGTRGWRSRRYGEKEPALSLTAEVAGALPVNVFTQFSPTSTAPTRPLPAPVLAVLSASGRRVWEAGRAAQDR